MSCPQIWKIEKDREKEKVRLQAGEAQREKELDELKKKKTNKETFFVGGTTQKVWSSLKKMRNASGRQGENERQ